MTKAGLAALIAAHEPVEIECPSSKAAVMLLRRRKFGTIRSAGYASATWLCAARAKSESFTAVARWEGGTLRVWGPIPHTPNAKLDSSEVGPSLAIQLPLGVWDWVLDALGEERQAREATHASAIRRAFLRARTKA